jgi:hypothetical protein
MIVEWREVAGMAKESPEGSPVPAEPGEAARWPGRASVSQGAGR